MNRLQRSKIYPFGLILCLEWILLATAVFSELLIVLVDGRPNKEPISILILPSICLIGLGLTGLRLPKNNIFNKWLYTFWQCILLSVLSLTGDSVFFTPYLIVVIRSCLIFNWRSRLLATILAIAIEVFFFILRFPSFPEFREGDRVTIEQFVEIRNIEIASEFFLIAFCSAILLIMVNSLLKEHESRQKLREYAFLIEDRATLAERNRIAREIHDSVGHILTALNIQLDSAIAFWQSQPDDAWNFLIEAKDLATLTLDEIRCSVAALRDTSIEKKSMKAAVNLLVKEFSRRTNISPQCSIAITHPLSKEIKITLYRILQEALTNIAKHSEAKAVKIKLKSLPEHLYILIQDNGKGFDPQQTTTGFGLQSMRERVAALRGGWQISSSLNCGCSITIEIPYKSLKL